MYKQPAWIGNKQNIGASMFADDDAELNRDLMGITEEQNSPYCFPKHLILELMTRPRIKIYETVQFVYVGIDPCAGSDNPEENMSDFVIVSICKPETVIVGIEAIPMVRHQDYEEVMRNHLRKIRSLPFFEFATFVFDIEANGNSEWSHIVAIAQEFSPVVIMSDYKNKQATNTTNSAKLDMMTLTRSVLDSHGVRILDNFVTSHPNPTKLWAEVQTQFCSYERICVPSNSMKTKNSVIFSGKGRSKNRKDDICLTAQRTIRSRRIFLEAPRYRLDRL